MSSQLRIYCLPPVLMLTLLFHGNGVRSQEESRHWSFQPIDDPPLPMVADTDWTTSPIDRFILARLEAEELSPADRAAPTKLIRRVCLDLTGLPPRPAEVAEFVADHSPEAYGHLVDRLLASPQYGERWARHWLDVARYADSNGLDENRAYVHAFNYRDYVIRVFNRGTPFDQFLKEQLAGDLLPNPDTDPIERLASRTDRTLATGFLSIGPKGLREVDGTKMEMDIIDDQVATVSKAFMALTFECARCHDHKFDPISTQDYYALAGIFRSTRTMTQIIDERGKGNGFWFEQRFTRDPSAQIRFDAAMDVHETSLAALGAELSPGIAKIADIDATKRSVEQKSELAAYMNQAPENAERLADYLELRNDPPRPPPTGLAMSVSEGTIQNVHVHVRGNHLNLGDEVARGVPSFLTAETETVGQNSSGRLRLAEWLLSPSHPLTSRVIVNRVWRWHFGHGLVRTSDNFGINGDTPSHPQLLDFLATDFQHSGWSFKRLHRMIALSSTYQQACRAGDTAKVDSAEVDPENRLLWHFPRLRMDAEQVRDSILFVSDQLDLSMGGSLLKLKPREYVTDAQSFRHLVTYDNQRRSVYQPVIRNKVYGWFRVFDFPAPSLVNGDRSSTNNPAQALLLMNSSLVIQSATGLAESLLSHSQLTDEQRVVDSYLTVLGRWPNDDEVYSALSYLESYNGVTGEPVSGWQSFLHALLLSNEFLYYE